jgi:hypothetical protein
LRGGGCEVSVVDPHVEKLCVVKGVGVADDELEIDELIDEGFDDEKGAIFGDGEVFALTVNELTLGLAVSKEAQIADTESLGPTDGVEGTLRLVLENGRND